MKDVILYRYFSNEATSEEVQQIEEWLKADPAHQQEFDAAHMLFNVMTLRQPREEEIKVRKMLPGGLLRRFGRVTLRTAAMVALLVGAGYVGARLMRGTMNSEMASRVNVLEVPAGQRISVTLEDGTVVWLNGGSRMEYPLLFAKEERRVKLSGEAMFDVEHDADHPFVVETFASDVEVLGTKFNVVAEEAYNQFSAALFEGRVAVSSRLVPGERIVLAPDDRVTLRRGHLNVERIEDRDEYEWTDGIISLTGQSFGELMRRFEKAFGVNIRIEREPTIDIGKGKIRQSVGIDNALQVLQQVADFQYIKDEQNNTIVIQ